MKLSSNFSKPYRLRLGHWVLIAAAGCAVAVGCTRDFYREHSDKEVDGLLAEKDQNPDAKIAMYHVYPDPRARYADQTCPDFPPMPPDDPTAAKLTPHSQIPGKDGVSFAEGTGWLDLLRKWDAENRAAAKADPKKASVYTGENGLNPETRTSLAMKLKPGQLPYLINLEQAVELSCINSREFQDAREDLYLAALPVALQRFAFTPQFFALAQALRDFSGSNASTVNTSGVVPNGAPINGYSVNSNEGVAQLFSTGALLLLNFANQTVINLSSAMHGVTTQSEINLDLIQPFLQGGGLAVTLENLTQAERDLVYQVLTFARFRKTFYVAIAGGGGGALTGATFQPQNVIANQIFNPDGGFGPTLTPGNVPPVTGPFPLIGNPGVQEGPQRAGSIPLVAALDSPVSGYLSTLLECAQMSIDKYNISKLEAFLKLSQSYMEGGDLSQLQVDQFEQALIGARKNLVNDQQDYLFTIDEMKLQLGLPTDILIELDDEPFRPMNRQFQRYEDLFNEYQTAKDEPARPDNPLSTPESVAKVREALRRIFTSSPLARNTRFGQAIDARWKAWEKLTNKELDQKMADYAKENRDLLDKKADLEVKGQTLSPAEQERILTIQAETDLGQFEKVLRKYEEQSWKKLATAAEQRRQQQKEYAIVVAAFVQILTEARNERMIDVHDRWPRLPPMCINGVDLLRDDLNTSLEAASQYAVDHRLDLMIVRAQVVDAWRQLAVFANALLGTFNVQYHMDASTPPNGTNPFAFAGDMSHQQLILNAELPLVRKLEQNNYRAALINFQRSRRVLQSAEDEVRYEVRQELINCRQFEEFYRLQTRLVELGYMLVENSLDVLAAPQASGQQATDQATRAAALANQLIQAQSSLYTAQFNMTTYWITYLNNRDEVYRDLEFMPLDDRGVWIDNIATCECRPEKSKSGPAEGESLPPPRPEGAPKAPEALPKPPMPKGDGAESGSNK